MLGRREPDTFLKNHNSNDSTHTITHQHHKLKHNTNTLDSFSKHSTYTDTEKQTCQKCCHVELSENKCSLDTQTNQVSPPEAETKSQTKQTYETKSSCTHHDTKNEVSKEEQNQRWEAESCLHIPKAVRRVICKQLGPSFVWGSSSSTLRRKARREIQELDTPIRLYTLKREEQRTNEGYYEKDFAAKVYQTTGLSLYCPIDFLATRSYAIVDTGAGANIINSNTIKRIVEANGHHAMKILHIQNINDWWLK